MSDDDSDVEIGGSSDELKELPKQSTAFIDKAKADSSEPPRKFSMNLDSKQ